MGIALPTDGFDYRVGRDLRGAQGINGDEDGELRILLDNGSWLYANLNRGVLLEKSEVTPPTATGSWVIIYHDSVTMSADTPHIFMEIYGTNVKTRLTIYDSIGGAGVGGTLEVDVGTGTDEASDVTADLTGRADDDIYLTVEIQQSDAPGSTPALDRIRLVEVALQHTDLPT